MVVMGSPKKKSGGPFKTLKSSFLRNKGQNIQLQSTEINNIGRSSKRKSVQRTTLFQHDYVKVRSWPSDNPKSINVISNKATFEIYEINMVHSKQRMNYLSIGKKDQFVHPILPKLKVKRLITNPTELKVIISLFNPQRFWEVTFLANGNEPLPSQTLINFENVMSKICQYEDGTQVVLPSTNTITEPANTTSAETFDDIEEEVDDLEFLLWDHVSDQGGFSEIGSLEPDESSTMSTTSVEHSIVPPGDVINKTFKQALGRIKPFDSGSRENNLRYKRFSSFHTTFVDGNDWRLEFKNSYHDNRRSISVPMSTKFHNDMRINHNSSDSDNTSNVVDYNSISWMNISCEDIGDA